jgi:hypothetical protein
MPTVHQHHHFTYKTTIKQDVGLYSKIIQYTAHETFICRNPRLHSYTGDKKIDILNRPNLSMLCFHENMRTSKYWLIKRFDRRYVCVATV